MNINDRQYLEDQSQDYHQTRRITWMWTDEDVDTRPNQQKMDVTEYHV